jgi:hypothetical protein
VTRLAFAARLVSRAAVVAAAVVAAAALALWPVPLYNRLGFEFAVAMCVIVTLVAGGRAAAAARAARGTAASTPAPFPGAALARVGLENCLLLVPPLIVQALRALVEPACDVRSGLAFYALLVVPAVVYGTGFGFTAGLACRRAIAAFAGWVLLVLLVDAVWLAVQPPKFTYDPIIGFFPGPLYDAEIPLDATLVVARAGAVLQALAAVALSVLAWDGRRLAWRQIGRRLQGERAALAWLAAPLVAAVVLLQVLAAPLGTRIHRGFIQRTLGGRIDTPHVRMYYDRATLAPPRAAALAAEHEARWAQLEVFFQSAPRRRIGSYVYASAAQKKRLMGAGDTSFEDAFHDEFHINMSSDDPHPVLMHEMAHIFAAQIDPWVPVNWKMGIHEGIAVAAEWGDESARLEMTPHEACAAMDSLGLLPEIERVLSAWGFWTQPGARAYTACGSFVRWLVDTRGMPRFRRLWRRGDFARAYGEPLSTLATAWRAEVRRVPPTAAQLRRAARLFGGGSIFSVPCAHEVAALARDAAARAAGGDAAGAESLWARVVALDPADASSRLEWARTRLRGGDAPGALALSRAVAADDAARRLRDRACRLAGDAAWLQQQLALADSFYAAGAAIATGSAEARAFEVVRGVVADPRLAGLLAPALADVGAGEAAAVAALAAARAGAPDSPLPAYLLGRRLFLAGAFEAARAELDASLALGGLGPEATLAARELSARADLGAGRAGAAAARLAALAAAPELPEWRRLGLGDRASLALRADAVSRAEPRRD